MKGEGFLRIPFKKNTDATFINTDVIKMPTYDTKVPYKGHICALSGAMIQNKLLDSLILIPDRGNSFQCLQNWKETKRRQIS